MSLRPYTLSKCARSIVRCSRTASAHQYKAIWTPLHQSCLGLSRSETIPTYLSTQKRRSSDVRAREISPPEHANKRVAPHNNEAASALIACPGCGAWAQTVESGEAGFYSIRRKAVSTFTNPSGSNKEDEIASQALNQADPQLLKSLGLNAAAHQESSPSPEHPLCDRCHNLIHHHVGVSIAHPSVDSLADTIQESPHKYNHIYHVLDAADFPFSLVPRLHAALSISAQRSKNRRSKHHKYIAGKITEITFVITRSDLLAPKKEQVDSLMPYLVEVLRDALGSSGRNMRLGNVTCVSAKRGWWVKELKADIWERGGGGWMVGKVNVGKSNLFEVVFPKGKAEDINFQSVRNKARASDWLQEQRDKSDDAEVLAEIRQKKDDTEDDEHSLLPPVRAETAYPVMPTVSSLPGTTASPIRIPFGKGRGELIDLPGLARGDFESFVRPEHHDSLLMKSRLTPEQLVLKPGSSLLLGGLIRITSADPDTVILAYPFLNLSPHLTNTEKATAIQGGAAQAGVPGLIGTEQAQQSIASAGKFRLQWDVTKHRAGPLTSRSAANMKPRDLPFVVLSADILVEGVGWVELVAQVRRKKQVHSVPGNTTSAPPDVGGYGWDESETPKRKRQQVEPPLVEPVSYPEVEVFSPEGRFIDVRRPMNAWVLGGLQSRPGKSSQPKRPRKSMKSARGSGPRHSDSRE